MSKELHGYLHIKISDDARAKAANHVAAFAHTEKEPVDVNEVVIEYKGTQIGMTMEQFLLTNGFEPDPCETCGGEGYVMKSGPVYPGEPHMADVDTEPCPDCDATGKANHE